MKLMKEDKLKITKESYWFQLRFFKNCKNCNIMI